MVSVFIGQIILILLQNDKTTMQQILLPGTDLKVSRLGFGTASLHHLFRTKDRHALLGVAFDAGYTHFDTARMYGEGIAERELGRFLLGRRQDVTIASKFGIQPINILEKIPLLLYAHRAIRVVSNRIWRSKDISRKKSYTLEAAEKSLTSSLNALQTDWIDIFFVHEPLITDADTLLHLGGWLEKQKKSGRVRFIGLAGNAVNCMAIAKMTEGLFDVFQVEDSLTSREADVVSAAGAPLQITYGYLRKSPELINLGNGLDIISDALKRNSSGMVLVSSRRAERLQSMAELAN